VWKSQRLLDKTSWSGSLEAMQYFATLNFFPAKTATAASEEATPQEAGEEDKLMLKRLPDGDEYWLTDDIIAAPKNSLAKCSKACEFEDSSNVSDAASLNPAFAEMDVTSSSSSTNPIKCHRNQVADLEQSGLWPVLGVGFCFRGQGKAVLDEIG
jgi:hypothetical protein